MAHHRPETSACISEEILGFGRKLPEESDEGVENPHLAQVRKAYGRGQGQLLPQLSSIAPK